MEDYWVALWHQSGEGVWRCSPVFPTKSQAVMFVGQLHLDKKCDMATIQPVKIMMKEATQ